MNGAAAALSNWAPWGAAIACAAAIALATWRLRPQPPARTLGEPEEQHLSGPRPRRLRRRRPSAEPFAAYLDALARELRVGVGVASAFLAVTDRHPIVRPVFGPTLDAVGAGEPLGHSLTLAHIGDPDAAYMVQALRCVDSVGGPGAATLDSAAGVLRERAAVLADAASHSAQARLSARVLTVVPLGFAGWGLATSEQTRNTSLASPIGAFCMVAGLSLNGLGWWWMRRIVAAGQPTVATS